MLLTNLTSLLNKDADSTIAFITANHSFARSKTDCSTLEMIHIDINTAVLTEKEIERATDLSTDDFITLLHKLGVQGPMHATKNQPVTTINVHTDIDSNSDIVLYITIVQTDLSIYITVLDPAL